LIKRWNKADYSCSTTNYSYVVLTAVLFLFLYDASHSMASTTTAQTAIPASIPFNLAALQVDTQITRGHPILLAQAAPLLPKRKSTIKREVVAEYAAETLAKKYLERIKNEEPGLLRVEQKNKQLIRVFLGPFQDQLEAQPVLNQLKQLRILFKLSFDDERQGYVIRLGAFESNQRAQQFRFQLEKLGIDNVKMSSAILNVFQVVRITVTKERITPPIIVDAPSKLPPATPPDDTTPIAQQPPDIVEDIAQQASDVVESEVTSSIVIEGLGIEGLFFDDGPRDDRGEEDRKPSIWADLEWGGFYKNETAYRYREPRSVTKIRNTLYLDARYPLTDSIELFSAGWAYYDLAYDLFNYNTIAARAERNDDEPLVFVERLDEEKDSNVIEIRELYADLSLEGLDLRIGKQFIVWGVLEGVRIVDEINPIDFRELINLDLLDYRISLWSLKLDYFREDTSYQLVWIPDLRFHKPAPRGSEWELLQNVCIGQAAEILCADSSPESWTLRDSELGMKMETYLWDTELSFSYFYTWDDFPVIFRSIRVDDNNIPPAFYPTYTRLHMFGSTAVKQLGRYILKGEAAFVTGKNFGTKNTTDLDGNGYLDDDGELLRNHIRWGLGVEFNILGMDIAPGIAQWIILDYEDEIMQDRFDTSINLFVRKELPEQAAVFQMLAIYLVNLEEILLKPEITFQFSDNLQMGVGLDLFYGLKSDFGSAQAIRTASVFDPNAARAQFIGNFRDNDRIFFDFKYSF